MSCPFKWSLHILSCDLAPFTPALQKCQPLTVLQIFFWRKIMIKSCPCLKSFSASLVFSKIDALPQLLFMCCSFCPECPIATLSPLKRTDPTHPSECCSYFTSLPSQTTSNLIFQAPAEPYTYVPYRHLPYYYNYWSPLLLLICDPLESRDCIFFTLYQHHIAKCLAHSRFLIKIFGAKIYSVQSQIS